MRRVAQKRKQVASTVDPELCEMFRGLSDKTRIPSSRLLDEALEDLLQIGRASWRVRLV